MKVLTESEIFLAVEIAEMEKHYDAKYVCETCVKNSEGGWVNKPVAVFYHSNPENVPVGGTRWFGLFLKYDYLEPGVPSSLHIVNAVSAANTDIQGIEAANGDVIYSRYRHDYRQSPDRSVWIDGGRDYTRYNSFGGLITLRIVRDQLMTIENVRWA